MDGLVWLGEKEMSVTDTMLDMFNNRAPIARLFGMNLKFDKENNAVVTLPFNPDLDHALGGVHGGIYATLMDTAGWFTVAVRMDNPKFVLVTSEMSMHFLGSVRGLSLSAHGKMIKKGRQQCIAEMFLYDENQVLVGHATGTFMLTARPMKKKKRLEDSSGE